VENAASTFRTEYFITPWNRYLPEKLTGIQEIKKFPALY
jgi:hypothetical protein